MKYKKLLVGALIGLTTFSLVSCSTSASSRDVKGKATSISTPFLSNSSAPQSSTSKVSSSNTSKTTLPSPVGSSTSKTSSKIGSGSNPVPTSAADAKKQIADDNKTNATPHPTPSLPNDYYHIPTSTPSTNTHPVLAVVISVVNNPTTFNLVHGNRLVKSWSLDWDGDGKPDYQGGNVTDTSHIYTSPGKHTATAWVIFKDGGKATATTTFTTYASPTTPTITLDVGDKSTEIGKLSVLSQTSSTITFDIKGIPVGDKFMIRFIPPSDTSNNGTYPFPYVANLEETSTTKGKFTVKIPVEVKHGKAYRLIISDEHLHWAEVKTVIR